ncbi:Peroxisomal acyl-coenzyme A oxidase 3 [Chionoecetes opilio]|uniref:Peroxisomal acyl-coenzyme A oxidase 3 n=1 Tax=Chionoecetes opilio TaxID=41210 RepID=A0A8J5CF76_CHIOP|nr:Peroxisomal acyl-coenzyme A oxidase 3 [Chionoecetes opilio]
MFDFLKGTAMVTVMAEYDFPMAVRHGLLTSFTASGIIGQGTKRHHKYLAALEKNEMGGCFCLTEIAHGSNVRGMRTEARYDAASQTFILHTPDFEAAKCWVGNLGKTASHGLVFAQLYTPDGTCHGLHCLIVPLRDPRTLNTFPGVTVVDMGPKIGLNGVDNGVRASRQVAACSAVVLFTFGLKTLTVYLHRLRQSPDSHCLWCRNVSETIEHFLLQCPRYHSHHVSAPVNEMQYKAEFRKVPGGEDLRRTGVYLVNSPDQQVPTRWSRL